MSKQLDAQIDSQLRLPFDGDYYRSPKRKFQETIVLVPFYGGRKNSMIRYVEFLTESGFDCVTFSLRKEQRKVDLKESYYSPNSGFGMKHLWADQVEKILNELPGPKILFGFSNPSASAIEAAACRGCSDISAIVCDSGPSGSLFQSMLQYFKQEEPIRFLPLRAAAAGASRYCGRPSSGRPLTKTCGAFHREFQSFLFEAGGINSLRHNRLTVCLRNTLTWTGKSWLYPKLAISMALRTSQTNTVDLCFSFLNPYQIQSRAANQHCSH